MLSQLQRRNARRIGHGNDHIHFQSSLGQFHLGRLAEQFTHAHTGAVDADAVNRRIGTSKVDVFEDVGRKGTAGGDGSAGQALAGDDYSFTCSVSKVCVAVYFANKVNEPGATSFHSPKPRPCATTLSLAAK